MTVALKPAGTIRKSKTKVVKIPTEADVHLAELAADQERSMGDLYELRLIDGGLGAPCSAG